MARRQRTDRLKDPRTDVQTAIRELRNGYRVGRAILRKFGPRADLGEHQIEQIAEEHGRTVDACRKLRQLVMLYDEKDLAELCDLCRRHRRAFRLSLVYKIVSIEDRKEREEVPKRGDCRSLGSCPNHQGAAPGSGGGMKN